MQRERIACNETLAVSRQFLGRWGDGASAGEAVDALELLLLGLIDAQYTHRPFYGSRRMVVYLRA